MSNGNDLSEMQISLQNKFAITLENICNYMRVLNVTSGDLSCIEISLIFAELLFYESFVGHPNLMSFYYA